VTATDMVSASRVASVAHFFIVSAPLKREIEQAAIGPIAFLSACILDFAEWVRTCKELQSSTFVSTSRFSTSNATERAHSTHKRRMGDVARFQRGK